jgi:hypothetical protein
VTKVQRCSGAAVIEDAVFERRVIVATASLPVDRE